MKNNRSGFTLIELLVVATIIVLLASVASVAYSQFVKQSRDAKRKTDIEQIRSALEIYRSNNDDYPGNLSLLTGPTVYIKSVPTDPKNTVYSYYYSRISTSDYLLGAYLEGTTTTCSSNISCNSAQCNYCIGPYGQ